MSNIKSTKRSGAVFLAAVLVAGILAAISPSFIIGVNAQYEPQYGMDTRHSSYEPEPEDRDKGYYSYEPGYPKSSDQIYNSYGHEYSPEYKDKEFNSYEPDPYGMDNDYDKKSYEHESKYPPYGKDDRYKSTKDSSSKKSVSLNKIKCINNNVNINGNNAGNVSIGNKGQAAYAEERYSGAYSSGGNGEGYDNGYKKQKDQGFTCIINNNNNNTNIAAGGNQTEPEPTPCENCFSSLSPTEINEFLTELSILTTPSPGPIQSLAQLCAILDSLVTLQAKEQAFSAIQDALGATTGVSDAEGDQILACLQQLELIIAPG